MNTATETNVNVNPENDARAVLFAAAEATAKIEDKGARSRARVSILNEYPEYFEELSAIFAGRKPVQKGEKKPRRSSLEIPRLDISDPDFVGLHEMASASVKAAGSKEYYRESDLLECAIASRDTRFLAAAAHYFANNPQGGKSHADRGNVIRDAFGPSLKVVSALETAGLLPEGETKAYKGRADWVRYAAAILAGVGDTASFEGDEPTPTVLYSGTLTPRRNGEGKAE